MYSESILDARSWTHWTSMSRTRWSLRMDSLPTGVSKWDARVPPALRAYSRSREVTVVVSVPAAVGVATATAMTVLRTAATGREEKGLRARCGGCEQVRKSED